MPLIWALLIGVGVGFVGGMFGKGGSAIATPLLFLAGVPAIAAVASPLPATVPGTALAAWQYHRAGSIDRRLLLWAIAVGVPATAGGSYVTRWIDGHVLIVVTELLMIGLGMRLLVGREQPAAQTDQAPGLGRAVLVCAGAGLAAGLLANSGGFLLAPLFITVLRRPAKVAFGTSLAAAAVLALPGTAVHAALGHIDWAVTAAFAVGSVPFANLGARVALQARDAHLERWFGAFLTISALIMLGG